MHGPQPVSRRRLWPLLVPVVLVVALGAIWTGLWFYAASAAETALVNWRAREAQSGRNYDCGRERIGGFPFRIELRCFDPKVELFKNVPPLALNGARIAVVVQVYQPTLLISEFTGPMTIAELGRPPEYEANWSLGQSSLRGTPRAPERGSLVFDDPVVQQLAQDGGRKTMFHAKRVELHGRVADNSVATNHVIEVILRTTAAAASEDVHPLAAVPLDADITATLSGLGRFGPKTWPERFREVQARGGKIEITKARLQQGETIAIANGALGLTERGTLDGQLDMTVVGIEQLLKALDLEKIVSQGQISANIDKLDRIIPGLGNIARKNAAPGIIAGLGLIGKRTTLEGKPAVAVPLRFVDGQAMLGPVPLGRVPPLF